MSVSAPRASTAGATPERDRRVEDARTVDVHFEPVLVRHLDQCVHLVGPHDRPARGVVRVLDGQQRGPRVVHVVGSDGARDVLGLESCPHCPTSWSQGQPAQARRAADFGIGDVRADFGDDLLAGLGQAEHRQQVALRAAGDEQPGLLVEDGAPPRLRAR